MCRANLILCCVLLFLLVGNVIYFRSDSTIKFSCSNDIVTTYLLLHENFIVEFQFSWPQNNWWEIAWQRSSIGATISLDYPRGSLDKLGVNKGLNSNRDQPSPTSVLDAPSEDSSCNEPEISGRTSKNTSKAIFPYHSSPLLNLVCVMITSADMSSEAVSRSSAIETVARFLSWDDSASESQLLCTPRTTSLMSDVDDDESECHVLVQNIMSSAGLGSSQSSMVMMGSWAYHQQYCDDGLLGISPTVFT